MQSSFAADKLRCSGVEFGKLADPPGAELVPININSVEEDILAVWDREGPCLAYPKADGWRIQIHKVGVRVDLYTRGGQDCASIFPKVVSAVRDRFREQSLILDVELVGFDSLGNYIDPHHLRKASRFLCYVLDALRVGTLDLTSMATLDRIRIMRERLEPYLREPIVPAGFTMIRSAADLADLYNHCLREKVRGLDGTIIKRVTSPYFVKVLKLKSSDTVDAVVIGAYHDSSTRDGKIDRLLLAVPDPTRKLWIPIAIVTRSNTDWESVWRVCAQHVRTEPLFDVSSTPHTPTVWVSPKAVVRVTIEGVRQTKNYELNAIAARHCELREDKGAEEATTYQQLMDIYSLSTSSRIDETVQPSLFDIDGGPRARLTTQELKQSDESYFVSQLSRWPELPVLETTQLLQLTLLDLG
jgi:ATP-dependent DNA ligase